jgi:hypothetical protein
MISIIRWFIGLFNKEFQFLSRSKKSHSHFILYLSFDALLSATIILVGFQVVASHTSIGLRAIMGHSGAVAMSSTEFIRHIKGNGDIAYWLGSISGHKYTHIDNSVSVITMTYWPQEANIDIAKQSDLTVATYNNLDAYTTSIHPIEDSNTAILVTSTGTTVKFNEGSMNYEIVTFKGKPEIVVVYYQTSQLATILMKNAANLKLVG